MGYTNKRGEPYSASCVKGRRLSRPSEKPSGRHQAPYRAACEPMTGCAVPTTSLTGGPHLGLMQFVFSPDRLKPQDVKTFSTRKEARSAANELNSRERDSG
jgi:hypothetical protein